MSRTFEDVARTVAAKYDIAYIIEDPAPPVEELDEDLVLAFLKAVEHGAEIELRGPDWHARDVSSLVGFAMGLPGMEPPNVFAYAGFPLTASLLLPDTRFYVYRLDRDGEVWHLYGRSGVLDCPATELVLRPVSGETLDAILQERRELPNDVRERILHRLQGATDPFLV